MSTVYQLWISRFSLSRERKGLTFQKSGLRDLDHKVDRFMSLPHRPLVSIGIKICSFIFKISCSQVRWDERTDGRTNGQRENIMTPPVSMSWWRNIKGQNSLEPGIRNFTHMGRKFHTCTKFGDDRLGSFWHREGSNFTLLRRLVYSCLRHCHTTMWVWYSIAVKR